MFITDEPPLIFFHIRKTAGNSVVNAIMTAPRHQHPLSPPHGRIHETVSEFVARVGEETFRQYRSFCFVRHPFSRFISHYNFLQGRREKIPYMQNINSVAEFIGAIRSDVQLRVNLPGGGHKVEGMATLLRPQHEYTMLGNVDVAVSHVFKQETMREDWQRICMTLGMHYRPLPELNKSEPHHIDDMNAVRAFVSDYYKRDFEIFGYDQVKASKETLLT